MTHEFVTTLKASPCLLGRSEKDPLG